MWIMLNNAFLSVVSKDCGPDELLVRARRREHIHAVFPEVRIKRTAGNDYLFRAVVKRGDVAIALMTAVEEVGYDNFKNSVDDDALHRAYNRVWSAMADLQEVAPYETQSRGRGRRQGALL